MLSNFVLPPALQAEVYQALALLPGIQVDSHVTTIAGQAGVAFVEEPTPTTAKFELILSPSTYAYLAQALWMPQYNAFRFPFTDGVTEILFNASTYQFAGYIRDGSETVITKEVAVSGPGSSRGLHE